VSKSPIIARIEDSLIMKLFRFQLKFNGFYDRVEIDSIKKFHYKIFVKHWYNGT
jgi:hypothetical protein